MDLQKLQEELRQKELAELARLKDKTESSAESTG